MSETEPDRWLTYAEAGRLLGKTPEAVRALARRQRWVRQSSKPARRSRRGEDQVFGRKSQVAELADGYVV